MCPQAVASASGAGMDARRRARSWRGEWGVSWFAPNSKPTHIAVLTTGATNDRAITIPFMILLFGFVSDGAFSGQASPCRDGNIELVVTLAFRTTYAPGLEGCHDLISSRFVQQCENTPLVTVVKGMREIIFVSRIRVPCEGRKEGGRPRPGELRRPRLVGGPIRSCEWVRESATQFLPSPLRRKIFTISRYPS